MNLQFLASLGIIPTHLTTLEPNTQIISMVQSAKDFSAEKNQVISGIFRHKEKKEIFILFSKKPIGIEVILGIIKNNMLSQNVTLLIGKVDDDIELQEAIIKIFLEKHLH